MTGKILGTTTELPSVSIAQKRPPLQETPIKNFVLVDERTMILALEIYQSIVEKTGQTETAKTVVLSTMFDP